MCLHVLQTTSTTKASAVEKWTELIENFSIIWQHFHECFFLSFFLYTGVGMKSQVSSKTSPPYIAAICSIRKIH